MQNPNPKPLKRRMRRKGEKACKKPLQKRIRQRPEQITEPLTPDEEEAKKGIEAIPATEPPSQGPEPGHAEGQASVNTATEPEASQPEQLSDAAPVRTKQASLEGKHISPSLYEAMREEFVQGHSLEAIANRHSVPIGRLKSYSKKHEWMSQRFSVAKVQDLDVAKEAQSWICRIMLQAKRLLHAVEVRSQQAIVNMPPLRLIQLADALSKADAIARRALRLDEPSGPANLHLVVVDTGQIANARAEAIEAKPVTLAIGQGDQAVPGPQP